MTKKPIGKKRTKIFSHSRRQKKRGEVRYITKYGVSDRNPVGAR